MWYAQNYGLRARQITGDGAILLWIAFWSTAAVVTYRLASKFAFPAAGSAASAPAPGSPGSPAARLPLVGHRVDSALRGVADAADTGDPVIVRAAVTAGAVAVFLVPVGLVLGSWLPRRLRWTRQAAAAHELAASDDGRELLALRSLLRPLDEVAATADAIPDATPGSLAEGWRNADPATLDALAEAELERLGLRTA
ncbi:hypothetical protein OG453_11225 [Streptomyces sp. NBC_01381]|uniref:hypothetical protein n=1 Tax=Streptomyces sp. NBC_01381 TaxID=2903845 RepID=UPI00224DAEC9|nr:hypothetical protein [Streptomyces sp. NBC_01381]MCX4667225.1 hypothetical protein [Streptomyces sp. NBC_01381]